jgi:hypothetical protein
LATATRQRTRKEAHPSAGRKAERDSARAEREAKRQESRRQRGKRRQLSNHAQYAREAFQGLRGFFKNDAQLAEALGWDEKTVAQWKEAKVSRPRRPNVLRVAFLHELCLEARVYLATEEDAGRWVTTPQPQLRGETPAAWVRDRGKTGLDELTLMFAEAPLPAAADEPLEPFDEDEAVSTLLKNAATDAGVAEFARMLDLTSGRKQKRASRETAAA